ncbi:MAG: hypothetical protein R6X13_03205 [bacterium]
MNPDLVAHLDPRLPRRVSSKLHPALLGRLGTAFGPRLGPANVAPLTLSLCTRINAHPCTGLAALLKFSICRRLKARFSLTFTQGLTPSPTCGIPFRLDPLYIVAFDAC